jgi:hypothetical protein
MKILRQSSEDLLTREPNASPLLWDKGKNTHIAKVRRQ